VTIPNVQISIKDFRPAPTSALKTERHRRSPAENSARIKDLGYKTSKHMKM